MSVICGTHLLHVKTNRQYSVKMRIEHRDTLLRMCIVMGGGVYLIRGWLLLEVRRLFEDERGKNLQS